MKLTVHEPEGLFRVKPIKEPLFACGKIWFTQNLEGVYQLHVGIFDRELAVLMVWKSRNIQPRVKLVQTGTHYHSRNPFLDEPIFERIVRVPFLTKTA